MKKPIVFVLLAIAILGITAMAQEENCAGCGGAISGASAGSGGVDIVGAIFEAGDEGMNFPLDGTKDTNFDFVEVGNDLATAISPPIFPAVAQATNSLEIKKNQDTQCNCCDTTTVQCIDCCPVNNLEKIRVGDRVARATGNAQASNNVKILTNQM